MPHATRCFLIYDTCDMKHPHTCNTTHWHMQHHAVSCHTLQHTANTLQHIAFACFHPAHTRHDALNKHTVPRCNTPSLVTCCQKSYNIRQERHTAYTSHYPIRQYCICVPRSHTQTLWTCLQKNQQATSALQNEVSATIRFQPQQRILAAFLSPTSSTARN